MREALQRTPQWRADRRGKLTCSPLSVVAYGGPQAWSRLLAAIRSGVEPNLDHLPAIRRGQDLERVALANYEMVTGLDVELVGFVDHPTIPLFGGSADGLPGETGILEIKCPESLAIHLAYCQQRTIPQEHWPQCAGNMLVHGRLWADFVSYCPEAPPALQLHVVRWHRDEDDSGRLRALHDRIRAFAQHLVDGTTPAGIDPLGPAPLLLRRTQP